MDKKSATVSLGDVLKERFAKQAEQKPSNLKEWQLTALDYANKLGIDWKNLKPELKARWMSLFKMNFERRAGKLAASYSFVSDYPSQLSSVAKVKVFFWRFNHLTH